MTKAENYAETQREMLALGGCPTAEPPTEMADTWRGLALRLMAGDPSAKVDAASMRNVEMCVFVSEHPEAADALEAFYATQTA